ncbi:MULTISPECIES: hypothetical protein [Niastella]|uniref:Glycosyltransferase RgtA/B/C/D-like domain-containing protein n=1 Tax=Niastella soli TaxID=2821487 RepID=A0ABS3YY49_9BACT|nr:hypothetical protein [Niastella soli]MBO9202850.1 hypothetical protein [Niastella soli]
MRLFVTQTICILLLVFVFWPVLFTDYAYMDEAHQLWHNDDNSNFIMFFEQGRGLTGLMIKKLFSSISAINGLKWIRVISFAGWLMAVMVWTAVLNSWKKLLDLNEHWVFFLSIFLPCSISVAIAIGWASCVELFLAFTLALLSGHLLFIELYGKKEIRVSPIKIILVLILALGSLFLYQPMAGAFLLPFFLCHLHNRFKRIDRIAYMGVGSFLAISLLYFLLFKFILAQYGIPAAERTALSLDPLKKISFFFSQPLAQAFSFNFLYNMRGIFSQAFYPVMFATWVFSVFALEKDQKLIWKFGYIVRMLLLMMLMYVSVLVPKESFASYRTILCLNLAGTILLTDAILRLVKKSNLKNLITYSTCGIVVVVAWFNFNLNYIRPLKKEYLAIHTYFQQHYDSSKTAIYFVRPPEDLFTKLYGQKVYKDEFGLPTGYKDWTPEPLIRQMIFEATGDREKAKQFSVVNLAYEERESAKAEPASIIIDEEKILQ